MVLFSLYRRTFAWTLAGAFGHLHIRRRSAVQLYCSVKAVLSNFHGSPDRKAYVDEIISLSGVPLWMEGPENAADVSWSNNVWGLPRLLAMNGGFLTGTLNNSNIVRDQLVLILLRRFVFKLSE